MKTVCIIGGGLGGLMTGALLAREDYRVTVLEKNGILGGGTQSFFRKGFPFDPCMHLFGGMQPGGNLRKIMEYLGIAEGLHFEPCHDTLVHDGKILPLPFGREAWIEAIGNGGHKEELEAYVDSLYALADTEDLFCMRPSTGIHREVENITARELIERHVSDPMLRKRLAYVAHLYDGTDDSPALLHALTSVLHIDGVYRLSPSASTLAEALAGIIAAAGGEIHTCCEVTAIEADGKTATAACCGDRSFSANHYVCDLPIGVAMRLAPQQAFSPAFRRRMAEARQCCSAFCVYGILKPHTLPYEARGYHVLRRSANPWDMASCAPEEWPHNLLLMTTPATDDTRYAATFTLVAPMDFGFVRPWEQSTSGHRPDDYRKWKEQMAAKALQLAEEAVGPLATEYLETASPLTLRDWNGTTDGSCYGLHATVLNPALTTLSPRTRLDNLFLTGQDVNFHGMVGTSLTAIITAEAILGPNTIVNRINNNTITKNR